MNSKAISLIIGLSIAAGCAAQANLPVLDSCIMCSSRTNISCATDPEFGHRVACENIPVLSGCYTRISEGFTLRGCASDLDGEVLATCQNNDAHCEICVGESNTATHGCNKNIFPLHRHRCHQCRGDLNGTCDLIPLGLPAVCEMFDANDSCYILRTSTTVTRGCMSSRGTNCDNPDLCYICELTGCNNINGTAVPIAPGTAVTNTVSTVLLSAAFIFALAKSI